MPYVASLAGTRELRTAIARRTARRLGACRSVLTAATGPGVAHAALLADALAALRRAGPAGEPALFGSELRALAASLESARDLAAAARRAAASPPGPRRDRAIARVFDLVARTPHLVEVAPRQVPDAGFVARAQALAARLLAVAAADLPLALAAHARRDHGGTRFPLPLGEDAERALLPGELAIGGTALLLRLPARRGFTLEIAREELRVRRGERILLAIPRPPRAAEAARASELLGELPRLDASPSLRLGRRLRSRPGRIRVGAPVKGLAARLGRALALVGRAWPEAYAEVHAFTEVVIPLDEPGTVSYSLAARPGVSYINVWKKPLLQLADDLLHETAHHKLHAVEELEPLVRDPGDPLWWSPWRGAWRPLRGIVHACYTFTYGALLFARMLDLGPRALAPGDRRFAARRVLEEEASLDFSLADLKRAGRQRRLAPAGEELRREMTELLAGPIRTAATRAEATLGRGGPSGRNLLAGLERHHRLLAAMRERRPGEDRASGPAVPGVSRAAPIRTSGGPAGGPAGPGWQRGPRPPARGRRPAP